MSTALVPQEQTGVAAQPQEMTRGAWKIKHGFSFAGKRHHLYFKWANIKSRCGDPNNKDYARYGGRGISMHPSWRDESGSFIAGVLDLIGDRPTPLHTLDRANNNGDYAPGNLKWATRKEQANNRKQRGQS